jgi:hypothetical protein
MAQKIWNFFLVDLGAVQNSNFNAVDFEKWGKVWSFLIFGPTF